MTKLNTFRHNQPASVASLRRLFAFSGTPFGFPLESAFTFTGIPNPSNAWAFSIEADILNNLHRPNEAITAAKEAIRLSDGKYSFMHFTLGSAYFESENWELARQSFQKAAELNPKDDAAAYNVAVCFARLEYYNDAAHWYEEAIRRNPKRDDIDELKRRIEVLRR